MISYDFVESGSSEDEVLPEKLNSYSQFRLLEAQLSPFFIFLLSFVGFFLYHSVDPFKSLVNLNVTLRLIFYENIKNVSKFCAHTYGTLCKVADFWHIHVIGR